MGFFGQKPESKIEELFPDEALKLEALYQSEVYQFIGGSDAPLSNTTEQQHALWVATQALERAAGREPYEFIWTFMLAKNYFRLGRFADAVITNWRALALHPNDARVEYALGTCYRVFMRAAYSSPQFGQRVEQANRMFQETGLDGLLFGGRFDPYQAESELQKLGMTWDNAAREAVKHFKRALSLGVLGSEKKFINTIIESDRKEARAFGVSIS